MARSRWLWVLLLELSACRESNPSRPSVAEPLVRAATTEDADAAGTASPAPSFSASAAASAGACGSLSRTHCMQSADCTLERASEVRHYLCRPARPPCEDGIRQADLEGTDIEGAKRAQTACASRSGCVYAPSQCFCECRGDGRTLVEDGDEASPCNCECGGGEPPRCVGR